MEELDFDTLLPQLLKPISDAAPAGRWMRYEPKFAELSRLREEDNPDLPMGDWERPLLKANWQRISGLCIRLLTEETKDFQIAGWLCDAWIRNAHLDGLRAGLALISKMAEVHWESAWPIIADGDADRRIAPFVWMNTHLSLTLMLHVVLLPASAHRSQAVRLIDWTDAPIADDAMTGTDGKQTRRDIRASVRPSDSERLRQLSESTIKAEECLRSLTNFLDQRLDKESPSLAKLEATVQLLKRATDELFRMLPAEEVKPLQQQDPNSLPDPKSEIFNETAMPRQGQNSQQVSSTDAGTSTAWTPPTKDAGFQSFEDRYKAYEALEAISHYLRKIDPHNPAPYLVDRAVELGKMPFPEMLQSITEAAGSIENFFELLGIENSNNEF